MNTTVVIIGAGQAGLAMSGHLTRRGLDHVVLEAGEVAQSWRTERWDSLRLLTPNWMTRLPGYRYSGDDPDGFMTAAETIAFLRGYQASFEAPVHTHTAVERVLGKGQRFEVVTSRGTWRCEAVVAATGASSEPHLPPLAAALPEQLSQLTALQYRNPAQLADGEVLVVGGSASGAQIADELRQSGRAVTLAVGDHVRVPRRYRGLDIHWWMDAIGQLDERYDEVDNLGRARRLPSLQLVGSPERRDLDLNTLATTRVELVGKLMALSANKLQFSGSLANFVASADLKQNRLLDRIDEYATEHGLDAELEDPTRPEPTRLGAVPTEMDLARFATVVWATGYRPTFPWLDPLAFDPRGQVAHVGGVARMPGLYVLGLPFLRRRKSSFVDGVGPDAADLADHLDVYLRARTGHNTRR